MLCVVQNTLRFILNHWNAMIFRHLACAAALAAASVTSTAPLSAQTGILVVAHGADSAWNQRVFDVVRLVHWNGPVDVAFVMGDAARAHSFAAGITAIEHAGARRIVIVPFMVSTFGGHVTDIHRMATGEAPEIMPRSSTGAMEMADTTVTPDVPVRVVAALDSSAELGTAIADRWRELPARDRARVLVLVAHGPNDDSSAVHWIRNIDAATRALAPQLPDRAVHVELLRDDAPAPVRAAAVSAMRDTITALARTSGDSVMVMTVLISAGAINTQVVPHDLAGMPMHYFGAALAPDPALARWIERRASEAQW